MTTKKPAKHPTQADVPVIDPNAEVLEPVAPAGPEDVPMPAIENAPGSVLMPKGNIGTTDVFEIVLMYLLELSNSPIQVQPGALRSIPLSAARVEQLSDRAKAHMQQLPPSAPVEAPAGTAH